MKLHFYYQHCLENLNNKFLCLLLVILALLIFFLTYPVYFFESYNGKRELQVIFVFVFHLLLFFPAILNRYTKTLLSLPNNIKWLLCLMFLSGSLSALFSQFYLYSFGDWVHYLLLLNVGFIAYSLFSVYPKAVSILQISVLCGFFLILSEFIVRCIIAFVVDGYLSALLIYPNPGNIRFLNQVHVQVFFAFPVLLITLPSYCRKWLMLFAVVGMFMLIIGGARGALISILFCILATVFFNSPSLKRLNKYSIIIMLFGFFAYSLYQYVYINLLNINDNGLAIFRSSSSGRLMMWLDAFDVFKVNLLGIGPYHYGVFSSQVPHSHVHNFIVQIFLEWGLIAGVALLLLLAILVKAIFYLFYMGANLTTLGLGYSVLCGLIYSFFSGVFVMPASQMIFVLLIAMLMAKIIPFSLVSVPVNINSFSKGGAFTLLGILLSFYLYYVFESYRLHNLSSVDAEIVIHKSIGPRMWVRGGVVVLKR